MAHELAIDRMSFGERLAYAFRERQIYVRSEGQVRFITLRPWVQISFVLLMVGVIGWIAYASLTVAFKDYVIAAKKRQFANVQTVYEDRITQMLSSMDHLNGRLLLNQDNVESQIENVRDVQKALEIRQQQIAALMSKQYSVSMNDLVPKTSDGPQMVEGEARTKLMINFEPVQSDIRFSRIPGKQSALGMNDAESVQAMRRVGKRLRDLATAQRATLNILESKSETRVAELAEAITSLGFKPERFAPSGALGGPLVQLASMGLTGDAPRSPEERQVVRISSTTDTIQAYLNALERFPVRHPLASVDRIASGFGPRRDPFTGGKAMHQGIDFPKPNGTPVLATAAGEVKRAGWGGAYGRLIEINHDNGVSTRYAHLSKIQVKVGQRVEAGQEIGLVGSTGRSTGAHLHYEARLNGSAVNPVKFFRVASHVFQ
ncbi:MAG: M23 family metallopeptidase [Rhizobiales bacterium]|nr:M23 family metallopeptidase [Hyphomicrobiales bacterium]